MSQLYRVFAAIAFTAILAHAGFAVTPPNQVSLNLCQQTVKAEGAKFVKAEILAISTCLQKISVEQIRSNAAIDNAAARTCITQFRKLNDSRHLGKSLVEKLTANIQKKCDKDFNPALAHTNDDITGKGTPGVPQPIDTRQLDLWCTHFGGDGSIDGVHTPPETTVQEWIDCIVAAHQCEVNQAIAEQYPRAAEWLSDAPLQVKSLMNLIAPPANDSSKVIDAVAGLTAVHDAIDSNGDNQPDLVCPQPPPTPTCSTACCYIEQTLGGIFPTACFQYTGTSAEVTNFKGQCHAKEDGTGTHQWHLSDVDGVCSAGPLNHQTCAVGVGNNAVLIPKDSSCP